MRWMRRLLAIGLVLLFIAPALCEVAPVILGTYPVPVAESAEFVMDWFQEAGFAVSPESTAAGEIKLKAQKGGETIRIEIRPQSPLGSRVEAFCSTAAGSKHSTINGLKGSLEGYIQSLNGKKAVSPRSLPANVLSQDNTVVCLKATVKGEPVQLTGFVIDRRGFIVATAHDLDSVHRIATDEDGGVELQGEVVKRDTLRDLSLIKVNKNFGSAVSVNNGRHQLKTGDRVYSIGCPQNLQGRLQVGIVDGPPALVNGQPLWQVKMQVLPGSSGSPVFDPDGRLVGVVKGRYRGTETRGFLIPLDTVRDFLRQEMR